MATRAKKQIRTKEPVKPATIVSDETRDLFAVAAARCAAVNERLALGRQGITYHPDIRYNDVRYEQRSNGHLNTHLTEDEFKEVENKLFGWSHAR